MNEVNLHLFDSIAWTIIHSLWQGALVFIVVISLFLLNKKWNAALRFNISLLSMVTLFIASVSTFVFQYMDHTVQAENVQATLVYYYASFSTDMGRQGIVTFINKNTLLISNFWIFGFLLLSLRYIFAYIVLYRYSRTSPSLDLSHLNIDFEAYKHQMGVTKRILIKSYEKQMSPFTLGFIKPMIFFPVSVLNALNTAEIEAILVHELAHIKRNDFIVNILTSLIEVAMYYHPVIWWLQKQLNIHRENACDDMAISIVGDRLLYARALVKLQENLHINNSPAMALAFTGNRKSIFLNRIKRMFNMPYTQINIKEKLIASLVLFLLALGITEVYAHKTKTKDFSLINNIKESLMSVPPANIEQDTFPKTKKKESVTIIKSEGNKEVEVKMEDGKVTYLNIDGKQIPESEFDQHRDIIDEIQPLHRTDIDRSFDGFGKFDLGDGAHGFRFDFGDMKYMPKGFKGNDFYFNFDSLKENILMGKDSMFSFFNHKNFNHDSLLRKFDSGQLKMLFPNGDRVLDLRHFPDRSIKIYRGEDMDELSIEDFGDDNDGLRIDRNDRSRHDRDFPGSDSRSNLESIIGKQLNRDGFLIGGKPNKVELSGKGLKINGEKQASNIWNKYKELFEIETGLPLSKDTKLVFEIDGKDQGRRKRSF